MNVSYWYQWMEPVHRSSNNSDINTTTTTTTTTMTTTTLTRIKTIFDVRPLPVSSNLIDKTLHTDHRGGAPFLEGGISIGVIVEFLDRPDEGRRRPFWWRAPCVIVRSAGAGAGEKADDRPGTTKAPGWSGGSSGDPLGAPSSSVQDTVRRSWPRSRSRRLPYTAEESISVLRSIVRPWRVCGTNYKEIASTPPRPATSEQ